MRSRGGGPWAGRVSADTNSSRGVQTVAAGARRDFGRGGASFPAFIWGSSLLVLVLLGCDSAPRAPSLAGIVAGCQMAGGHPFPRWAGCASPSLATSRTARIFALSICGDRGVDGCPTLRLRGGDDGEGEGAHGGGKKRKSGARQAAVNTRGSWSQGDDAGQSLKSKQRIH